MKRYNTTSREGYSIISAVLLVGFLLILTTSTLNLVLQELQDGRGLQWYISAYAGAEWALELALLDMKNKGYGYDDDTFQNKQTLWSGPKYPEISYEFNSKVESYSWSVRPLGIDIIPLFSIDTIWRNAIDNIEFENPDGKLVWNLVTQSGWTSGIWSFDMLTRVWEKTLNSWSDFVLNSSQRIQDILSWEDYLIVQNLDGSASSTYTLKGDGWWFTLPRAEVISSAQVWKYQQNLKTVVDNTEFLWVLRYSVYSWN